MIKERKVGKYIFLSIITLGIYSIVFWYKWAKDVNKICEGDDKDSANYILVLILDFFSLFFYAFVWNYQMAERMFQKAADYNVALKHGGMFIAIWRVLPFVSSVYKIKYINRLAAAYNATVAAPEEEAPVEDAPAEEAEVAAE